LEVGAQRGKVLLIPTKHGEGRYVHPEPSRLTDAGQVLMRYCTADGRSDRAANPNGSVDDIAGITNSSGNVIGLMPHPEHAVDPLLGSTDGRVVFAHAFASTVTR
jgi:phosphoribosylformylglycinamidine synthase